MANARQFMAARTAELAKSGGWVNPYGTDGLIAMWDGEGSDHANGVISDVSGNGHDFTVVDGNISFEAKSFYSTPNEEGVRQTGATCNMSRLLLRNGAYTIEAAYEVVEDCTESSANGPHRSSAGFTQDCIIYTPTTDFCRSTNRNESWHTYQNDWAAGRNFGDTRKFSVSFYNDNPKSGSGVTLFVNGQIVTGSFVNNMYSANDKSGDLRLFYIATGTYRLFNLRIYNGKLSQDDVLAKYAIDRARFNLT